MIVKSHTGGILKIGGKRVVFPEAEVTPSPESYSVLYLYNSDAGDDMRLNDTGSEGLSSFAAAVNALSGYSISEMDADVFDPSTDLSGIDVLITGSCNRVFNSTEEGHIDTWVRAGGGIIGYSDSAMGNSGGYQNQFGQASRHSMGFPGWGWEVFVDQVDNVQTRTLPASHFLGNALTYQGEGTSPWVVDANTGNHAAQGNPTVITARPDQTPSHTQGVTFTGTVTDLGYSMPGSGRVLVLFDRQPFWNGGAGSDITQEDNNTFLMNCVKWLATGISQA